MNEWLCLALALCGPLAIPVTWMLSFCINPPPPVAYAWQITVEMHADMERLNKDITAAFALLDERMRPSEETTK